MTKMNARDRLELIGVKIGRANEHFRTLEIEVRQYLDAVSKTRRGTRQANQANRWTAQAERRHRRYVCRTCQVPFSEPVTEGAKIWTRAGRAAEVDLIEVASLGL